MVKIGMFLRKIFEIMNLMDLHAWIQTIVFLAIGLSLRVHVSMSYLRNSKSNYSKNFKFAILHLYNM